MINDKGLNFIAQRVRPLGVNTMEQAVEGLTKHIAMGPPPTTTPESWARHLAWVIGFDTLVEQRTQIHEFVSMVVRE